MKNIHVGMITPSNDEAMINSLARLTQRNHIIETMEDVEKLFGANQITWEPMQNSYNWSDFVETLSMSRHRTLRCMNRFTFVVLGASRRFLAQIRTHQHLDFMSGSLQYSDHSGEELDDITRRFVVPFALDNCEEAKETYLTECRVAFKIYKDIAHATDNDTAGYVMPQGMRNLLVISGNQEAWQHTLNLRLCRRNTDETRWVCAKIAQHLHYSHPALFPLESVSPDCASHHCREGKMSCGDPMSLEGGIYYDFNIGRE